MTKIMGIHLIHMCNLYFLTNINYTNKNRAVIGEIKTRNNYFKNTKVLLLFHFMSFCHL